MQLKRTSLAAALLGLGAVAMASGLGSAAAASGAAGPVMPFRAHMYFDDTTGAPATGIVPGARASILTHPKIPLTRPAAGPTGAAAPPPQGASGAPPDPEVLGFVQSGEVSSGSWTADLHFNLLSTIAYFAVNVNPNGTLVTGDSGYTTWWSNQESNLINAAHSAGDRVVLTVKAFNDSLISSVTGSEQARQALISSIIDQVVNRPADGVNVDFEGVSSSLSANFTTFIAELQNGLDARAGGHSYLTVDTYASAGQGGTMYDLASLWHHVDALDLMGYGFEPCTSGEAGPSAPMGGCWYNVTQAVGDYMTRFGVPGSELLLGVPYYGYKWNVSCPTSGCTGQDHTTSGGSADTYAGVLSDLACAQQLHQHWDATFEGPWASWYSPASGDPCMGNHGSSRELYYDNAQSLGLKYDLVNNRGLRGIGIWALGYDSGTNDLWNEIAAKFTVTKFPPFVPKRVGPPAVTVARDRTQLIFWPGASGHLMEAWWNGQWNGPVDWTATNGWSSPLGSAPSVTIAPDGTQVIFWQAPGGHLVEAWWNGRWNGPVDWTAANGWSPSVTSTPSVAIDRSGTQVIFWQGAGGHLTEAWWNGSWNGPIDWTASQGWGSPLNSAPSVAFAPDGTQLIFWRGPGNHLIEVWWNGRWNGPADWTAANSWASPITSTPSLAIDPSGTQVIFWQGAGGHLTEAWWNGRWNGPVDWTAANGWGLLLSSAPSVTFTPDGTQLIFWQGAGSHLVEAWWNGGWSGPVDWSA